MENFFTELLKFFGEFTWKKLVSAVAVLAVAFIIFSIYERYTSSFTFGRLQRAADLLATIETVNANATNSTPELDKARKALITQAVEAINTKPLTLEFIPATLKFSMDGLEKFLAGGLIWYFGALTQIGKIGNPKNGGPFFGLLFIAILSGIGAVFVPSIWWPWFHVLIYPWLFLIGIIVLLLPVGYLAAKKAAKQKLNQ